MGSENIKKQLSAAKLIRPQSIVDIVQEFLKLYQFPKKKKPPPPVTKTAEVKPEEVKPVEVKPEEVKTVEVKPDEVKPDEIKPEEDKPKAKSENKPRGIVMAEVKSVVESSFGSIEYEVEKRGPSSNRHGMISNS